LTNSVSQHQPLHRMPTERARRAGHRDDQASPL
jgi:hypothetical protein